MPNLKFKPLMELAKYHKKRFEFQTASVLHTIQNFLHLQVVIVGNGAVGKSSMIQRYCRGIFTNSYKKTIGVDFLEKQLR